MVKTDSGLKEGVEGETVEPAEKIKVKQKEESKKMKDNKTKQKIVNKKKNPNKKGKYEMKHIMISCIPGLIYASMYHYYNSQEGEIDIFRDTLVRYVAYSSEVGESFRYVFPWFVIPSYCYAIGFCVLDVIDKCYK